jgi:Reverse transcriptase (RNA-dependent DNA polymerase)
MLDNEIESLQMGHDETVRSMAYADDIWFVVKNEQEASRAFQAIRIFCEESDASLNTNKSAFMRLNKCNLGR